MKKGYKKISLFIILVMVCSGVGKGVEIPEVYSGIKINTESRLFYVTNEGDTLWQVEQNPRYSLSSILESFSGSDVGADFDMHNTSFQGILTYGFIPEVKDVKHPYPVYRREVAIDSGRAAIDIKNRLKGKYDFVGWEESGQLQLGYRIANKEGEIIYDGKIRLRGRGPFEIDTSIVIGPFINLVTPYSAVVSFETNFDIRAAIEIDGRTYKDSNPSRHHEIAISGLQPDRVYVYTVKYGANSDQYHFQTAPLPGSRKLFTFAYASDCRSSYGGGERYIRGVNAYMMKRVSAVANFKDARFMQFTGDLIDGYSYIPDEMQLEYANWKRTIEPFAAYFPVIVGMGNHETFIDYFRKGKKEIGIDGFPFDSNSAEYLFGRNFVNPANGPESEDGAAYDPDLNAVNFPSYKENLFYYTYDNVAMVVLNSSYWFSYTYSDYPEIGGNPYGYLMDNQIKWLRETLDKLQQDETIDHIFTTCHTPIFPNGGHVNDDMWWQGNNDIRPYVSGHPVGPGILERRDELIKILSDHSKVVGILTGDEHSFNILEIKPEMPRYPDNYDGPRLETFRPLYQITNGSAGAPYYGQEETPWQDYLLKFTSQNAIVFFHIDGPELTMEVINPDTFEKLDERKLR